MRISEKSLSLEKGDLLPALLIVPSLFIVVFVQIVPVFYGLAVSLFRFNLRAIDLRNDFIGLGNYIKMTQDPLVWKSLKNSLSFTLMATSGDVIIGTIVSLALHHIDFKVSKVLRPLITIPLLVSPIIAGLVWRYMFDPLSGIIYWFLHFAGIGAEQFPGIAGASTALFCTAIAHWWRVTPFVIIVVTAGLVSIPNELYEAGRIDGAGFMQTFFRITLPHLRHIYMVIILTSGVDTIKVYDIIYSMTAGGPYNSTMPITMYAFQMAFVTSDMSYAMSISILSLVVSFLIFGIIFFRFNKKETEEYA
jgi:multiple sugar transport system permease protein